jgi:mono/diheme cytochrome c family protein
MLKCAAMGAGGAALVIALTLAFGCGSVLGTSVCRGYTGLLGERAPVTVKSTARHEFYRREGVPAAYRGKANPFQPSIPLVLAGADLFDLRCAICHGPMGLGNGQASGKLRSPPADLSGSMSNPDTRDDFLFWTIAEGGTQFGTDMPAFKDPDLSDKQIWQIIGYMRAAFEGQEARATTPSEQQLARNRVRTRP